MSASDTLFRLRCDECAVLVIDVQEKLLPAIADAPRLLVNSAFLLDAAKLLDIPRYGTEQYPKGLGKTARVLSTRLPADLPSKVGFSGCAVPELVPQLRATNRVTVVLCGIETHVCVLHTALDLLDAGFQVAIAADAVAGRFPLDHDLALRRMERAGALLTTVETIAFEWLGSAAAPQFKAVSALVQQRARDLPARAVVGASHGA